MADRFLTRDRGAAIDLATGGGVDLVWGTCGGVSDETRWFARCTEFARVRHPAIAPLVDFGVLGEGRRFEAWRSDGEWRGPRAAATLAIDMSRRFLTGTARTMSVEACAVRVLDGQAVVRPSVHCGYEFATDADVSGADTVADDVPGLERLQHAAIAAVGDFLREARGPRLRALAVWGPRGAGLDQAALEIARHARVAGFVPLSATALNDRVAALICRRSICVIVRGEPLDGWRQILDAALSGLRPRVVLFVGDRAVRGVHTLFLQRFSVDALTTAVRPRSAAEARRAWIVAAARQSQGLPARMAAALWRREDAPGARPPMRLIRAAERAADYHVADAVPSIADVPGDVAMRVIAWPVAAETVTYRQQLDRGLAQLSGGRHARGARACREAIAALLRRQDWNAAWRGVIALAWALRQRGRVAEASALVRDICPAPDRTAAEETRLLALIVAGTLATDALRLDESETVLSSAVHVARGLEQHDLVNEASLALARCLFWRGRYDHAESVLGAIDADPPPAVSIAAAIERSRLAVGRCDLQEAIAQADLAQRILDAHPSAPLMPRVALARGFAHLAIGDHRTVEDSLVAAVHGARAARLPLAAVRAQLLRAESLRRQGQAARASRLLRRVLRVPRGRLPEVVRMRADLLTSLLQDGGSESRSRQALLADAPALALFASSAVGPHGAATADVVEILRVCQAASQGDRVLRDVALLLRTRLDAVAVAVFSRESEADVFVCGDGGRIESALAERVCACGQVVGPQPRGASVEAGAPIRYGGQIIGALVMRWSLGGSPGQAAAASLLETAAAAVGPALAERRTGATEAALAGSSELLGVSRAMCDLRAAVDRAGAAPFSVLIQGESGCGKELVARALHRRSGRRDHPCAVINCASLPDELVESELFGHARGAFTGAVGDRSGVFEAAHRGTLFLDEIGELSLRAQAKLLRAIQEGEIRRVGENVVRRVDVRLIAATNRDLRAEADAGRFRADLLYRLDVIRIVVPPLRDRPDDVVVLAEHVWRDAASRVGSRAILGAATLAALARYHWPGNVRELQNVLAGVVVRSPRRGVVPPSALPEAFHDRAVCRSQRLDVARREFDARFVQAALARAGGCRAQAARDLGVSRQGLTKLMARLDMTDRVRDMVASD